MPDTKKIKIFKIAKDLNISYKDIVEFLEKIGIEGANVNSSVNSEIHEKILIEFSKDKASSERYRKEQARISIKKDTSRGKDTGQQQQGAQAEIKSKKTAKQEAHLSVLEKIKAAKEKLAKEKESEAAAKAEKESLIKEAEKTAVSKAVEQKGKEEKPKSKKSVKHSLKIISRPDKQAVAAEPKPKTEKPAAAQEPPKKQEKQKVKESPPRNIKKLKKFNVKDIANRIVDSKKHGDKSPASAKKVSMSGLNTKTTTLIGGKSGKKKARKALKKRSREATAAAEVSAVKKSISVPEFTTVDELARSMDVNVNEVIKKCIGMGMMASINYRLDMETIILIADEFGFEVETVEDVGQEILDSIETEVDGKNFEPRPPVVTVMGHVDHGKTSLLDYIRKENVVAGESGGITQHIGAYKVHLETGQNITFIDTPGHAAFTAMRSRGAQVTDIVIVIVAADDAVMPQTIEAINHARAAEVPIVIAINKVDRPNANPDKIKRELSEQNILVEDWGGKYQCAEISAKTGLGIDELMEKVLIEAEMLDLKAPRDTRAKGVVIESRLDRGYGAVATVLIQQGTLKKGDIFICGTQYSKVRALLDERNNRQEEAFPSEPIQVLGFSEVPGAGDKFVVLDDEREARKIALQRSLLQREAEHRRIRHLTLEQIGKRISQGEVRSLKIIIKGDVDGSIEAISDALMALSTDEVNVEIIHRSVGMITENDVSLATASGAIILAFNVNATTEARSIAKAENIDIRHYSIIYDAINDVRLALEGLLTPDKVEEIVGMAEVRALFRIGRKNVIAGSYMRSGKALRNAMIRIKRDGENIYTGKLTTLKRFKEDVNEVKEGFECGISVDGFSEFKEGDIIEFYEIKEVKRTLA